jgi:hypothetical protein
MKRAIKLALHALAGLFATLAIVFAVLAWRLSAGPISLGFLSPYVAEAFEAEDSSYRVEFSDTILSWAGWQRSLDILVRDVRVFDAEGRLVGSIPELSLGLSGLQLLRGEVAPTSIELLRPEAVLHRARDGTISFGLGPGRQGGGTDPAVANLLGGVIAPRDPARPLGLLREVRVREASVIVEDEALGLIVEMPRASFVLGRTDDGIEGKAEVLARIGDLELPLAGTGRYVRQSETIETAFRIDGINPARIATLVPELEDLAAVNLPLSGELEVSFKTDGRIGRAAFDLAGDAGVITLPTAITDAPLEVEMAQARGEIGADHGRLVIDDLFLDFGGPSLTFNGVLTEAPAGTAVEGTLNILDLPFDSFARFWPKTIAPGGRRWITQNVSVGVMRRISATLALPPGRLSGGQSGQPRESEIEMDFEWTGATMNYLSGLPKVVGVDGSGRTNGRTMTLEMRDGTIGGIRAPKGSAEFRDIGSELPTMTILVELEGEMDNALAILDAKPLGYAGKVGLTPAQVKGQAKAQVGVQLPLLETVPFDQIGISATATIQNLAVERLFQTFRASKGALTVLLDSKNGMEAKGTINLDDTPASVTWRENFSAKAPFRTRYDLSLTLDDATRERLGLSLAPYITGPLPVVVRYTETDRRGGEATALVEARAARIDVPELDWAKPPGEDASLALELSLPSGGPPVVRSFALQARDARFEGSATLDPGLKGIRELTLSRLLLGLNDLSARIVPPKVPRGPMRIEVGGESLDLRPYLRDLMAEGGEKITGLELGVDVKRLITRSDQQVTDARGRIVFGADGLRTAFLEGTLTSGAPLRLRLEPEGKRRRLVVQSEDAGAVARAFDVYDNAVGGRLYLEAYILDDLEGHAVEGFVQIDDFKVRNAPTLANLLAFASLTGIVDVMRGDGLPFDQLYMPYTVFGDTLTLKDAKTAGTSLGVTASGTFDLATDLLDIEGTIVPLYAVNSALGAIPLIGDLLTGGEGGGLFAATYTVRGPLAEPTITVNPLAVLAPGFLRNLFSIFDGGGATSGGTPPPRTEPDR